MFMNTKNTQQEKAVGTVLGWGGGGGGALLKKLSRKSFFYITLTYKKDTILFISKAVISKIH